MGEGKSEAAEQQSKESKAWDETESLAGSGSRKKNPGEHGVVAAGIGDKSTRVLVAGCRWNLCHLGLMGCRGPTVTASRGGFHHHFSCDHQAGVFISATNGCCSAETPDTLRVILQHHLLLLSASSETSSLCQWCMRASLRSKWSRSRPTPARRPDPCRPCS